MTHADGERHAPSGWYPDPQKTDSMRWWDGERWTPVTRPASAPTDLRGKRLLLAGYILITAGTVGSYVTFPWVASEPLDGHKDPNPLWVTVLSPVALVAVALGIACLVAHWIVRRRRNTPTDDSHQ